MPVYEVTLEKDDDGFILVKCMDPRVASQGDDREDALRSIKEAIACYVEATTNQDDPEVEVEVVEVERIAA